MNDLSELVDQGRMFAEQHVPAEVLSQAVPVGAALLAVGVLISVLGARLVRPVVTLAFAGAGAALAMRYAHLVDVPLPVTGLVAAVVLGGVGYALHRLWVGLLIAVVASSLALSVFGYYRIVPELPAFQETYAPDVAADAAGEFALLDPSGQAEYNFRSPKTWARDFWAHLTSRQADIGGKIAVIVAGAALVGLLFGLLATRGALIACTALVGTSLVMSGVSLLVSRLAPDIHASAVGQPRLVAGAWAGLLLASLVLQALLNRRAAARPVLEAAR